MIDTFGLLFGTILRFFRATNLLLENLVLRQQLAAHKRRRPRPKLGMLDKLFWVLARRFWSGWKDAVILVNPETVVRWHRAGFRLYWKLISKVRRPNRAKTDTKASAGIDLPHSHREFAEHQEVVDGSSLPCHFAMCF